MINHSTGEGMMRNPDPVKAYLKKHMHPDLQDAARKTLSSLYAWAANLRFDLAKPSPNLAEKVREIMMGMTDNPSVMIRFISYRTQPMNCDDVYEGLMSLIPRFANWTMDAPEYASTETIPGLDAAIYRQPWAPVFCSNWKSENKYLGILVGLNVYLAITWYLELLAGGYREHTAPIGELLELAPQALPIGCNQEEDTWYFLTA